MAVSPPHQPRMGLAAKRSSAAAKKSVAAYDEKQVKNLQFPEFVRARPSQLIGNIGKDGVFTIFREVLDNVVDEALAGRCNALYAHIDPKSKTFTVMDNGNGIPVGMIEVEDVLHNKHKVSALRAITGIMQTSGKYDDKAYATSRGCFAGDTEVQLLSGKTVTMEQLYNRWQKNKAPIPVMSFNLRTQKLEPSHISYAQLTKHTRDIVKVTLDSGDVIRVTPDHPFYVNTTSGRIRKVEAGKLRANDSLVSTYYSSDRDGYRKQTEQGRKLKIHRVVSEFYEDVPVHSHVHHKNGNKQDNRPTNLEVLSHADHKREHREEIAASARHRILTTQKGLRRSNSKRFTDQNKSEWHKLRSQRRKAVNIAARVIVRDLPATSASFDSVRKHTDARFDKAVSRFADADRLWSIARRYVSYLRARVGRSMVAEDTLAFLSRQNGHTPKQQSDEANLKGNIRRWCARVTAVGPKCTAYDFNVKNGVYVYGPYAKMYAWTTLANIKAHVFEGADLVLHADLSEDAKTRRMNDAEAAMRDPDALEKLLSYFASSALRVSGPLDKEAYESVKSSSAPRWDFVSAILRRLAVESGDNPVDYLKEFNHRVVRVEHLQLKKPIPVYDITVDNTHVFFINPGVLVSNTHGLGLKATNALSTKFVVTTFSKGQWWNIAYAKGKVVGSIKKGVAAPINPVTGNAMKKGTWVQFVPDASVLEADMLVPSDVQHWSTIAAYFTPGLGILLAVDTPKGMVTKKFYAPEGPVAYLRKRSTELSATPLIEGTENDPFEKVMFTASNALLDCAVTFTSYSGSEFSAHTNGLQNREGGTHVDSFYKALRTSLTGFLKRGQELNLRSLKEGIVGIVNAKLSEPKFSSQDKVRLTDPRTAEPAVEFLTAELTAFLKKNRALATAIIEQAIAGDKLYSAYKLDKEASRNIKKIVRQGFPSKAKIAPNCKPEHRELYLVEGDSAGGCFSGDTLVNTTEGPMRLDAITAAYDSTGKVFSGWAFDCESKSIVSVRLTDPRETKKVQCLTRVEFDDGTSETCTHDHRWLMTAGYYTEARFLRSGDSVQAGADGRPTDKTVVQTYDVDSDDAMPVYDVTVPGYENFQLASGPFVHNSAKLAHYHNFQEIFPLRGKIVNAERAAAKATANEEVQGIFALLGYNPSAPEGTDPLAKLRISKLIFMADPDIDGPLPGDTEVWVKMADSDSSPAILMTMAQLAGPDFFDREYYVYTHNGQAMTWAPATNCMVRCVLTSWKNIVLDNGIEQPCSPTHQWLAIRTTQGGDTPVLTHTLDLKPGDHICFRSEEQSATRSRVATSSYTPRQPMRNVLIERIEDVQGPPTPFYCLTVPTFHTFMLGNEMMSGNCHINSLLLTLVAKYAPSLFARGMVYIAHVAEYYAYDEKTDTIYTGATANDVANKLATASKRLVVNHVKGYGEMDPAQLRKLAFDKSTRTLLRVVPEDASMKEFRMLMGNDAKVRREMIGID